MSVRRAAAAGPSQPAPHSMLPAVSGSPSPPFIPPQSHGSEAHHWLVGPADHDGQEAAPLDRSNHQQHHSSHHPLPLSQQLSQLPHSLPQRSPSPDDVPIGGSLQRGFPWRKHIAVMPAYDNYDPYAPAEDPYHLPLPLSPPPPEVPLYAEGHNEMAYHDHADFEQDLPPLSASNSPMASPHASPARPDWHHHGRPPQTPLTALPLQPESRDKRDKRLTLPGIPAHQVLAMANEKPPKVPKSLASRMKRAVGLGSKKMKEERMERELAKKPSVSAFAPAPGSVASHRPQPVAPLAKRDMQLATAVDADAEAHFSTSVFTAAIPPVSESMSGLPERGATPQLDRSASIFYPEQQSHSPPSASAEPLPASVSSARESSTGSPRQTYWSSDSPPRLFGNGESFLTEFSLASELGLDDALDPGPLTQGQSPALTKSSPSESPVEDESSPNKPSLSAHSVMEDQPAPFTTSLLASQASSEDQPTSSTKSLSTAPGSYQLSPRPGKTLPTPQVARISADTVRQALQNQQPVDKRSTKTSRSSRSSSRLARMSPNTDAPESISSPQPPSPLERALDGFRRASEASVSTRSVHSRGGRGERVSNVEEEVIAPISGAVSHSDGENVPPKPSPVLPPPVAPARPQSGFRVSFPKRWESLLDDLPLVRPKSQLGRGSVKAADADSDASKYRPQSMQPAAKSMGLMMNGEGRVADDAGLDGMASVVSLAGNLSSLSPVHASRDWTWMRKGQLRVVNEDVDTNSNEETTSGDVGGDLVQVNGAGYVEAPSDLPGSAVTANDDAQAVEDVQPVASDLANSNPLPTSALLPEVSRFAASDNHGSNKPLPTPAAPTDNDGIREPLLTSALQEGPRSAAGSDGDVKGLDDVHVVSGEPLPMATLPEVMRSTTGSDGDVKGLDDVHVVSGEPLPMATLPEVMQSTTGSDGEAKGSDDVQPVSEEAASSNPLPTTTVQEVPRTVTGHGDVKASDGVQSVSREAASSKPLPTTPLPETLQSAVRDNSRAKEVGLVRPVLKGIARGRPLPVPPLSEVSRFAVNNNDGVKAVKDMQSVSGVDASGKPLPIPALPVVPSKDLSPHRHETAKELPPVPAKVPSVRPPLPHAPISFPPRRDSMPLVLEAMRRGQKQLPPIPRQMDLARVVEETILPDTTDAKTVSSLPVALSANLVSDVPATESVTIANDKNSQSGDAVTKASLPVGLPELGPLEAPVTHSVVNLADHVRSVVSDRSSIASSATAAMSVTGVAIATSEIQDGSKAASPVDAGDPVSSTPATDDELALGAAVPAAEEPTPVTVSMQGDVISETAVTASHTDAKVKAEAEDEPLAPGSLVPAVDGSLVCVSHDVAVPPVIAIVERLAGNGGADGNEVRKSLFDDRPGNTLPAIADIDTSVEQSVRDSVIAGDSHTESLETGEAVESEVCVPRIEPAPAAAEINKSIAGDARLEKTPAAAEGVDDEPDVPRMKKPASAHAEAVERDGGLMEPASAVVKDESGSNSRIAADSRNEIPLAVAEIVGNHRPVSSGTANSFVTAIKTVVSPLISSATASDITVAPSPTKSSTAVVVPMAADAAPSAAALPDATLTPTVGKEEAAKASVESSGPSDTGTTTLAPLPRSETARMKSRVRRIMLKHKAPAATVNATASVASSQSASASAVETSTVAESGTSPTPEPPVKETEPQAAPAPTVIIPLVAESAMPPSPAPPVKETTPETTAIPPPASLMVSSEPSKSSAEAVATESTAKSRIHKIVLKYAAPPAVTEAPAKAASVIAPAAEISKVADSSAPAALRSAMDSNAQPAPPSTTAAPLASSGACEPAFQKTSDTEENQLPRSNKPTLKINTHQNRQSRVPADPSFDAVPVQQQTANTTRSAWTDADAQSRDLPPVTTAVDAAIPLRKASLNAMNAWNLPPISAEAFSSLFDGNAEKGGENDKEIDNQQSRESRPKPKPGRTSDDGTLADDMSGSTLSLGRSASGYRSNGRQVIPVDAREFDEDAIEAELTERRAHIDAMYRRFQEDGELTPESSHEGKVVTHHDEETIQREPIAAALAAAMNEPMVGNAGAAAQSPVPTAQDTAAGPESPPINDLLERISRTLQGVESAQRLQQQQQQQAGSFLPRNLSIDTFGVPSGTIPPPATPSDVTPAVSPVPVHTPTPSAVVSERSESPGVISLEDVNGSPVTPATPRMGASPVNDNPPDAQHLRSVLPSPTPAPEYKAPAAAAEPAKPTTPLLAQDTIRNSPRSTATGAGNDHSLLDMYADMADSEAGGDLDSRASPIPPAAEQWPARTVSMCGPGMNRAASLPWASLPREAPHPQRGDSVGYPAAAGAGGADSRPDDDYHYPPRPASPAWSFVSGASVRLTRNHPRRNEHMFGGQTSGPPYSAVPPPPPPPHQSSYAPYGESYYYSQQGGHAPISGAYNHATMYYHDPQAAAWASTPLVPQSHTPIPAVPYSHAPVPSVLQGQAPMPHPPRITSMRPPPSMRSPAAGNPPSHQQPQQPFYQQPQHQLQPQFEPQPQPQPQPDTAPKAITPPLHSRASFRASFQITPLGMTGQVPAAAPAAAAAVPAPALPTPTPQPAHPVTGPPPSHIAATAPTHHYRHSHTFAPNTPVPLPPGSSSTAAQPALRHTTSLSDFAAGTAQRPPHLLRPSRLASAEHNQQQPQRRTKKSWGGRVADFLRQDI
ncbi:hypothetical protein HDU86_008364 [Geranomyces michiganensis]|nr:hypothetical protein HDU86_008364 [Geranomyces michiganensis]